mgnify:CR=1 FL=1
MAGFREINVAGPMYRGAPYPKFNPKKINESKFEDGLRAKRWEASINLAENTGHVVWESQEDENPTSAWEDEVMRAFKENGLKLGSTIHVEFGSRDTGIIHEYDLEV